MAPLILSNVTRILLLFIFGVLIGGAVYQCLKLEIYYTKMYFVSDRSEINKWFDLNEKYFSVGGAPTITYVFDNTVKGIDFSEVEV